MNIILLGPPGSGKGTQARLLTENMDDMVYFEAGRFARELAKKNNKIKEIIEKGDLIPEDKMTAYVYEYLDKTVKKGTDILFDGYPRFVSQYEALKNWLHKRGEDDVVVIYLDVGDDILIKRLSSRRLDEKTGKSYNLITNPPPVGVDVSSLIQRKDDVPEAIKERLLVFKENTLPVVNKAKEDGILIAVDGDRDIKEIHEDILSKLKEKK